MSALDVLFDKGEVSIKGHLMERLLANLVKLCKENADWILGFLIYESHISEGFAYDETHIHMVERDAIFCPWFDGDAYFVTKDKADYDHAMSLKPLEVKPMTQEEAKEIKRILNK